MKSKFFNPKFLLLSCTWCRICPLARKTKSAATFWQCHVLHYCVQSHLHGPTVCFPQSLVYCTLAHQSKEKKKGGKTTTELRAVKVFLFLPFLPLPYTVCAQYLPAFSAQTQCSQFTHAFQHFSWDSHPIVSFKFHFLFSFTLQLSLLSPSIFHSPSHPCRKERKKRKE